MSSLYPLEELSKAKSKNPPVLQGGQEDLLLLEPPPPYAYPAPEGPAPSAPSPDSTMQEEEVLPPTEPSSPTLSHHLRLRREQGRGGEDTWSSHALPLRSVAGQIQYWPFSASDLYNWKTHNTPFSQDPQALTGLIESILLTHQPT